MMEIVVSAGISVPAVDGMKEFGDVLFVHLRAHPLVWTSRRMHVFLEVVLVATLLAEPTLATGLRMAVLAEMVLVVELGALASISALREVFVGLVLILL